LKARQQLEAYRRMPDSVLFRVQRVRVPIKGWDLPGPTHYKATCSRCGQVVRDRREVLVQGEVLCKPCAHGAYFEDAQEITWSDMNWTPDQYRRPWNKHEDESKQSLPELRIM